MLQISSKYGNWTILKDPQRIGKKLTYECQCNCGNIAQVRSEVLKKRTSQFCRKCMYKTKPIKPGDVFGGWIVLQEIHTINLTEKRKAYLVKCNCGSVRILRGIRLRFGDSTCCRKCGSIKHDMVHSKTYSTWESMIQRCTNSKNRNYKHYGARGIKVCESWIKFENFLSDMGERPDNKELDRIDNDGNYDKNNCRWITHQENLNNRVRKSTSPTAVQSAHSQPKDETDLPIY